MFVFCSDTWYMYLGFTLVLWTEKKPNIVLHCLQGMSKGMKRSTTKNHQLFTVCCFV